MLHDREADQHHHEHEAADQGRLDEIGGELAADGEAARHDPGDEQEPGRDEHDRPVVTVRGEMHDEHEADSGHRRDGHARDAGGDRRIDDREPDESRQEGEPEEGHVAVADMPAVEVQVSEQEDQEGRGENRFGGGAVDALADIRDGKDALEEAEIDARIGEHRPSQRRRRREDERALDHEHDRQEQRQEAGDADDDALVERQPVDLLLVGIGLPEIDLRHVRRAQLGHVGHRGAGIEGDQEDVGVRALLTLGPDALARRDGGKARGAEIGPDDARSGETEMRRDEETVDLLVGVVGEGEDDPVGTRVGFARLDGDAAHDAVAARGRGDLDEVAVRAVMLDGAGEVDGGGVGTDPHRFHRVRRGGIQRERERREERRDGKVDDPQRVALSSATHDKITMRFDRNDQNA